VANVGTRPHTEHYRTEEAAVDVIRPPGCKCQPGTAAEQLDINRVAVLLRCAGCGQPRIALTGELPRIIDELIDLYAAAIGMEREGLYAEEDREPASAGPSSAADIFGRWLAHQAPGTIQPPPRPPRDASQALSHLGRGAEPRR
jgi:hypothetical protein